MKTLIFGLIMLVTGAAWGNYFGKQVSDVKGKVEIGVKSAEEGLTNFEACIKKLGK